MDVNRLAHRIDGRFPSLTEDGARTALAVHRTLALGKPVPDYAIAAVTGKQIMDVRAQIDAWPGVFRDTGDRIIGFWGLGLQETDHRLVVNGRELFAWCAWDTLFLPELLDTEVEVSSKCQATGNELQLVVGPDAVLDVSSPDVAVSFVDPDVADVDGDRVISTFCHHILFFSTRRHAVDWADRRADGTFVLGLDEAFKLGRLTNELRYGGTLDSSPTVSPIAR